METALTVQPQTSLFFDVSLFEHSYRVAKMMTMSTMVPAQFKGPDNIGNCMIALNLAHRMGLDPFMVMQKMYIIQGKPGIEAQLIIAMINNSGRFSQLQFSLEGEGKDRRCTAHAKNLRTGEMCSQVVSMKMAESEGWTNKSGSKWKTLPDLMLQYRSAAFFGRLYCPEMLLGMQTKDEIIDSIDMVQDNYGSYSSVNSLPEPGNTDIYKTVEKEPVLDIMINKINQAFESDPIAAKSIMIEVGTDKVENMSQEQAEKFLLRFDEVSS